MIKKFLFIIVAVLAMVSAATPAFAQDTSKSITIQSKDCQQLTNQLQTWLKDNHIKFDQSSLQKTINKYFQVRQSPAPSKDQAQDQQDKAQTQDQSKDQPKQEQPKKASQQQSTQKAPEQTNTNDQSNSSLDQYQPSQYEKKVVQLVNDERAKQGLDPLKMNNRLSGLAHMKSKDMADNNYFSHTSPTYGSPFEMMKQFDFNYRTAGENIAAGQRTPESVVQGWMNSPGHRANILNESFTQIGVGYVEGSGQYGTYWTQEFITPQ
ncbi:CAP domain-containing protein [Halobacillus rhizosphaerae]|uniref:CAP domain-containing protein n=1 Tax=Halobacillus rhizosphaerae TaxID=3064889 RepID=UPI00398AC43D